jgi:toxin ParE1/3/4
MKPVVFHPEAEAELRAGIDYYEGQRQGLGAEFRDEVEAATARIAQSPQACPPYGDQGLRKCVLLRFPYTLFYLELDEVIWVAAVAHQRRRPGYWKGRQP